MPRILHLADLHLGRIFHGESLIEDQAHLLSQVTARIKENPPDAVLLAGDLYDRALPPIDAVRLFDKFLSSLAETGTAVVAIPGNHDSAGRMAYASGAWENLGIHIRADYRRLDEPIRVNAADGSSFDIFALPFVEPALLRETLGLKIDSDRTANRMALAEAAIEIMRKSVSPGQISILIAHEFVAGSIESGSERLYVGGSQSLPAELFQGFDYVALGHLHATQTAGDEVIRYAGSPMAYAFDEAKQPKGFLEISLDSTQLYPEIEFHPLKPLRPMLVLEDSLDALLRDRTYDSACESYVSARINDGLSHLNLIGRLRERFPYLRELRQLPLEAIESGAGGTSAVLETTESVMSDFLDRAGWEPGDERDVALSLLADALDSRGGEP